MISRFEFMRRAVHRVFHVGQRFEVLKHFCQQFLVSWLNFDLRRLKAFTVTLICGYLWQSDLAIRRNVRRSLVLSPFLFCAQLHAVQYGNILRINREFWMMDHCLTFTIKFRLDYRLKLQMSTSRLICDLLLISLVVVV